MYFRIYVIAFYTFVNLSALFVLRSTVSAQDEVSEEPQYRYQLDLGGHAALGVDAAVCTENGDQYNCVVHTPVVGVNLAAQYRLARRFAVGVLGSLSTVPRRKSGYILFWRATAEGRYYAIAHGSTDLWLSSEAGLVGANASLSELESFGEPHMVEDNIFGLGLGLGVGADFEIVERLALGFVLRTVATFMKLSDRCYLDSCLDFSQAVWIIPGINIRYRL